MTTTNNPTPSLAPPPSPLQTSALFRVPPFLELTSLSPPRPPAPCPSLTRMQTVDALPIPRSVAMRTPRRHGVVVRRYAQTSASR